MSPGRILYFVLHRPRERLETVVDQALFSRRDARMRQAAQSLQPLIRPNAPDLPVIRFLTGERFAHLTLFCARSLVVVAGFMPRFEFFDDGSLTRSQSALLLQHFPTARVVSTTEALDQLDRCLPRAEFPTLRKARDHSFFMCKLLDLRVGFSGPSLYLDSDMLFFAPPTELLAWLRSPVGELHMSAPGSNPYVDTVEVLNRDLGLSLPRGLNAGILALDDSTIDWHALERAASLLGPIRIAHKWAEQTLSAWLLARPSAHALDPATYRVCASRADLTGDRPVLRHYVHKAKHPYVASEWKRVVAFT